MVQKLISLGPDLSVRNEAGRTAFAEAEEFDKFAVAVQLLSLRKYWLPKWGHPLPKYARKASSWRFAMRTMTTISSKVNNSNRKLKNLESYPTNNMLNNDSCIKLY
jgi:ankyrin repeat protein